MAKNNLTENSKVIACNHVIDGDDIVRLVYDGENEFQLVCGNDNHESYDDFHEVKFKELSAISKNLKTLNFPTGMNSAIYDSSEMNWSYTRETKVSMSPVDGFEQLAKNDTHEFLAALNKIKLHAGFWVIEGPNGSIGGRTLEDKSKYVCIWDEVEKFSFTFRLLTFLGKKKPLKKTFLEISAFYSRYNSVLKTHKGFIIHSNQRQFVCPFDDFVDLLIEKQ